MHPDIVPAPPPLVAPPRAPPKHTQPLAPPDAMAPLDDDLAAPDADDIVIVDDTLDAGDNDGDFEETGKNDDQGKPVFDTNGEFKEPVIDVHSTVDQYYVYLRNLIALMAPGGTRTDQVLLPYTELTHVIYCLYVLLTPQTAKAVTLDHVTVHRGPADMLGL